MSTSQACWAPRLQPASRNPRQRACKVWAGEGGNSRAGVAGLERWSCKANRHAHLHPAASKQPQLLLRARARHVLPVPQLHARAPQQQP